MRRLLTRTLVAVVAAAFAFVPLGAGAQTIAPVVVGVDAQGDWGGGGDNALVGHAAAQDLTGAKVGMPNADTVNFIMELSFLPSTGGIPEGSRYTWNFNVVSPDPDDPTKYLAPDPVEVDGKYTNYSRGACDPTSGQCDPADGKLPRDPGPQPFFLRGNCVADPDTNVTTCEEIGKVQATFNPGQRSITVPVPAELINVVPCSIIAGGVNLFGGSVSASPSAFFSTSAAPLDNMEVTEWFFVPPASPEQECPEPPAFI